jgi:hypothetical protein
MAAMASFPARSAFSRRSFLAVASAAGVALLVPACTSDGTGGEEPVTAAQADSLADQVTVQRSLVAAYEAAAAANAGFGREVAPLAEQARTQLTRLEAASPGSTSSASPPAAASTSAAAVGADPRAWLRQQVTAAADSHAAACLEQAGARAALLGSLAAGLRGHAVRLG